MKYVVFYSWQSDLPNSTNRGFIETVLNKAIKGVVSNHHLELELSIDKDTKGTTGSPNISQTVLDKISTCDSFVADISIVTGDKEKGLRLSPNPNVLLELGYAISVLGWDKIIMFCNTVYGDNDDLPFDIRPHKRIPYQLKEGDEKSELRRLLAKEIGSQFSQMIRDASSVPAINQPILIASWMYSTVMDSSQTKGRTLPLSRISGIGVEKQKLFDSIEKVKQIDGSIDPLWRSKTVSYERKVTDFLTELDDPVQSLNYQILCNCEKIKIVAMSIENEGTVTATDIHFEFIPPDWLMVIDELPEIKDLPDMPIVPKPVKPIIAKNESYNGSEFLTALEHPGLSFPNVNPHSSFYLKNNTIMFWADRLLHKHTMDHEDDTVFIIAKERAPTGEHVIKGRVFCSEYTGWEDAELIVSIN